MKRKKVLFGGWLVGLIENLGRASQKERNKEKKNLLAETYMQYTRFITTKKSERSTTKLSRQSSG